MTTRDDEAKAWAEAMKVLSPNAALVYRNHFMRPGAIVHTDHVDDARSYSLPGPKLPTKEVHAAFAELQLLGLIQPANDYGAHDGYWRRVRVRQES